MYRNNQTFMLIKGREKTSFLLNVTYRQTDIVYYRVDSLPTMNIENILLLTQYDFLRKYDLWI